MEILPYIILRLSIYFLGGGISDLPPPPNLISEYAPVQIAAHTFGKGFYLFFILHYCFVFTIPCPWSPPPKSDFINLLSLS